MIHLVFLLHDRERQREIASRKAVAAKTPGLIRGDRVELACPACFANGWVEVSAPARINHIGKCEATPFVRSVAARKP